MHSCSAAESVHQTQVFSVRCSPSFPSLGPIASGRRGRPTRLSGRNFCSLIVQQTRGSLAERFKCKRHLPLETPKNERTLSNRWRRSLKAFTQDEIRRPQNGLNLFRVVLQLWNRTGGGCDN